MRIAVGIPSYQESDSIAHVTRQIDDGLAAMFDPDECFIINVDSNSPDHTARVFLETQTRCRKLSFMIKEEPRGKGANVLRFFEHCVEHDVAALAIFDADLRSITPEWVMAILESILRGEADYVVPLYQRHRFDGSTTNHFAYPLMRGFFGVDLRQPIGGDFGFSPTFVKHLLRQPIDDAIRGYGIDIFLTMHGVGSGFKIGYASLGSKLHKPSLPKWPSIAPQVIAAAIGVARLHRFQIEDHPLQVAQPRIGDLKEYPSYEEAQSVLAESRRKAQELIPVYRNWMGKEASKSSLLLSGLENQSESRSIRVCTASWTDLLSAFVAHALWTLPEMPAQSLAHQITPALILRSVSFWNEMWGRPVDEMNTEIELQARLFREKLLARMNGFVDDHCGVTPRSA